MAATETPVCDFGWQAPGFVLPGVDNNFWSLDQVCKSHGVLVMFICNHCPYVQSILPALVKLCEEATQVLSIGVAAISSNDCVAYPEDDPDHMVSLARRLQFSFPYLYDSDQSVAKEYGAVCTPDFFVFNNEKKLQYRGRYDASGRDSLGTDIKQTDLWQALALIAETGQGPKKQYPSIGCSIKWRKDNTLL